ncbi:MAG: hypothetical protein JWO38_5277 [Gemmataceae bacterium]|nr:hypothetical protein [Gemmataceae bacterium]
MNCQTLQNRILALPDPRQVPDGLREHLDACPACAAWWKRAAQLEQLLGLLPVPAAPADKKAALLDDLTAAGPVIKSIPSVDRRSGRSAFELVGALPGLKYVAGLAAAVLVVLGGWLVLRPTKQPEVVTHTPRHPFLEKVIQRDLALTQAKTPEQRLEVLGGLADDLSAETRSLARVASQEDLKDLSAQFQKVVDSGIVPQAKKVADLQALTQAQKKALFERLSARLAEAGQQADQAARESPPHAQPVLKAISEKARDGQTKLGALLPGGGA